MALQELPKTALSPREREIAALVAEGLTNREIGQRLFISERTADGHLEHIREKLGVTSRAQVAAWYVAHSQDAAPAVVAPPLARRRRVEPIRIALVAATLAVLLLLATIVPRLLAPPAPTGPVITTVAGSTPLDSPVTPGFHGGYSGDFGPATSAQLNLPEQVALSPKGFVYIADTANRVIRMVDLRGNITTLAGGVTTPFVDGGHGPKTGIGVVNSVAVSPDQPHLLYFSNGTLIARIDTDYSLHRVSLGQGIHPSHIRFASDGTLYIADTFADKIWQRAADGSLSVYAGSGVHGFNGDQGAATGALLRYPTSLAVDAAGNLFFADTGNNRIRRVDAQTGVITTVAGSSDIYGYDGDGRSAVQAHLSLPFGVAVAPNGDVYIGDTGNNRVRRVDAKTHLITTVAGTGKAGFAGDGAAAVGADLYGPYGVAVDGEGNLYVVDKGNHRVRMVRGVAR